MKTCNHSRAGWVWALGGWLLLSGGCRDAGPPASEAPGSAEMTEQATSPRRSFSEQLEFLRRHTEILLLEAGSSQVAVAPAWQGRVMTSTAAGPEGPGYGWINEKLIASGEVLPHMNPYGGEDRLWLGPEGGQFAIYFPPGVPFEFAHWQVPAFLDTEPFEVVTAGPREAVFRRRVQFRNYSGTEFDIELERTVRLIDPAEALPGVGIENLQAVAFESVNRLTNRGRERWSAEKGLLSIWILGMFPPSDRATVVIPYRLPEGETAPAVNNRYFGKVPPDRLVITPRCLFFRADGKHRSKIGLPWKNATPVAGSWDALNEVLTIVQYDLPETPQRYVNSMWELQEDPYAGDVINAYNDGPPAPGEPPLGPFYELETSSPARELSPGETLQHRHRTIHVTGDRAELDRLARERLGVGLEEIPW
ncbi:MAG: hypothetical protein Kow00109_22670 [Acidobacteriota bacterium]